MHRLLVPRQRPTVWAGVALSIQALASKADACPACTDLNVRICWPEAIYGWWFVAVWFLVMLLGRVHLQCDHRPMPHRFVSCWTLGAFAILVAIGLSGSLGDSLAIGGIWLVFLCLRLLLGLPTLWSRPRTKHAVGAWLIHACFLLAAVVALAHARAEARSPDYCIATLHHHVTATYSTAMPRIVTAGARSVPLLIAAGDKALRKQRGSAAGDADFAPSQKLIGVAFCLGKIGGPQAEAWLQQVVRQHVDFTDYRERDWQKTVCYAYARCAGERAVDDLVRLYQQQPVDTERITCALLALALTGCEQGVRFVLDHLDDVLKSSAADGNEERVLQHLAHVLLSGFDPAALQTLPVHRDIQLIGDTSVASPSPDSYASEFYWTTWSEPGMKPLRELRAELADKAPQVRQRWVEGFESGVGEHTRPAKRKR